MMQLWNELAKLEGYNGIYVIATKSNTNLKSTEMLKSKWVSKVFVFEPMNYRSNGNNNNLLYTTFRRIKTVLIRINNKLRPNRCIQEKYSTKRAYKAICNRKMLVDEFYGFFTDWDNSPRYRNKSIIFVGSKLEMFNTYFNIVFNKACSKKDEFLFINAWNEWGESAYLEPDELNQYGYLEVVKRSVEGNEKDN